MRILVVLNENPLGSHPDVYESFELLTQEGIISGFDVIPFLHMRAEGKTDQEIVSRVKQLTSDAGHELVIWMHTGSLEVRRETLDSILQGTANPRMIYWEGDSYHPLFKPLPPSMSAIMSKCDQVYVPCGGPLVHTLRRAGVRSVAYAPSCASGTRFPHVWRADETHKWDIVVVGNRSASRIPFKTMPGARRRRRMFERLIRTYGEHVAVYGRGWSGQTAMGPCAFDDQSTVYESAMLTVGVNNSTYPHVFSNRLPIALATGIPVLYHRNPGYEQIFPASMDDVFFDDETQIFKRIDAVLNTEETVLDAISVRNRVFFEENLSTICVARFIVKQALYPEHGSLSEGSVPAWQRMQPLVGG